MYQVFNMGHRFEIFTDKLNADKIISIAAGFNLEAQVIGHCEASEKRGSQLFLSSGNLNIEPAVILFTLAPLYPCAFAPFYYLCPLKIWIYGQQYDS